MLLGHEAHQKMRQVVEEEEEGSRRERGEKDGGLLQACARWWVFRGRVQRADKCVLVTPGAPYLVLAVKCSWKQALNQALNLSHSQSGVEGF